MERRELTALCYDLVGSTGILARYDLDDVQALVSSFQERIGAIIRQHLGSTRDSWGDDGGMAFFGYPRPMEDGAAAAIRAGLDIVKACGRLSIAGAAAQVRVGIATSEVVVDDARSGPGPTIVGLAPALAARLQTMARPDTIFASDRTRVLAGRSFTFRNLGPHRFKGFDVDQPVWEVGPRLIPPTRFFSHGRLGIRMVGRQDELDRALSAWRRAVEGNGHILNVQGEAGIGKSRLVLEMLRATRRETGRRLVLQCSPQEMDTPLGPLIALLRSDAARTEATDDVTTESVTRSLQRAGVDSVESAAAIALAIGTRDAAQPAGHAADPARLGQRLLDATINCIDRWATSGPVLVVIEDIHWMDPTSAALLRAIGALLSGRPLLLLLTSRRSERWTAALPNTDHIRLRPFRSAETASFAAALWSSDANPALPADALQLLAKRTNGVPLFIEELLHWLRQIEAPLSDWSALLSKARSLRFEAILSTRLGALGSAKFVAQSAAVIGRDFDEDLLSALVRSESDDGLAAALIVLSRAKIIARRGHTIDRQWTFQHALIQETLYKSLGKSVRRAIHKKILDALEGESGLGTPAPAATLGVHAEGAGLEGRAAAEYVRAAKGSFAQSAIVEAKSLLGRAQVCVEQIDNPDERARTELLILAALGPLLTSTEGSKSAAACQLYERAMAKARERPQNEQAGLFPIYWGWWFTGSDFAVQKERAEVVRTALREVDNPEVQLQVHHCAWAMEFNLGHHRSCLSSIEEGLGHYRVGSGRDSLALYGGHDARVCALGETGLSLWFQGFPTKALAAATESMTWARKIAHIGSIAHAHDITAMLHRYREDLAALHEMTEAMRALSRKHDLPSLYAKALIFEGWRIAKLGDPARGRRSAEQGFAIQTEIGTREDFPVYTDMRAEILDLCSESRSALELLDVALDDAKRTSHLYWVPELCRRRAMILAKIDRNPTEIVAALESAMRVALAQDANMLFLRACGTALRLVSWAAMADDLTARLPAAEASVEQGGDMEMLLSELRRVRVDPLAPKSR